MPYASLDEAFNTYTSYMQHGGADNETSNSDLVADAKIDQPFSSNIVYTGGDTTEIANNAPSMGGNTLDIGTRLVPDAISALSTARRIQVPSNQSVVVTPDDGRTSAATTPGGVSPPGIGLDCSDNTCMSLINHLLSCNNCSNKLRQLLQLTTSSPFGIDMTNWDVSKILFWLIIAIIVIAIYELLNSIFSRFGKS